MVSKKSRAKSKSARSEKSEKAGEIAKNIWLAGLGAYGKAYDVAADAGKEADAFFEGLVERGQELEQQTREQVKSEFRRPKIALEERIEKMRSYLNFDQERASEEIDRLQSKVKSLEEKLKQFTTFRK